jgi:hypothetical protein
MHGDEVEMHMKIDLMIEMIDLKGSDHVQSDDMCQVSENEVICL